MTRASRRGPSVPPEDQPAGLLERALTSIADAVFITDRQGRIVWVNDAFSRVSGYSPREAIGKTPSFLKSGEQDLPFYRDLWQSITAGSVWSGEVVERRKDGSLYTVDEVITPLQDDSGAITHFVATQRDVTWRKQKTERERYLAYHDPLTGLANRARFLEVLYRTMADGQEPLPTLGLLYVDIDNFKSINDTLGHYGGDRLLAAVAERLSAAVRKTDTVARLGGDEFAVLQSNIPHAGVAAGLARKLLHVVSQPFVLEGHKIYASVSIGVAIAPADGGNADDLLRNADIAMYRAKNQGRNNYQLYGQIAPHISHLEHGLDVPDSAPDEQHRRSPFKRGR